MKFELTSMMGGVLKVYDDKLTIGQKDITGLAGIFHRKEVPIEAVKEHMRQKGIETR